MTLHSAEGSCPGHCRRTDACPVRTLAGQSEPPTDAMHVLAGWAISRLVAAEAPSLSRIERSRGPSWRVLQKVECGCQPGVRTAFRRRCRHAVRGVADAAFLTFWSHAGGVVARCRVCASAAAVPARAVLLRRSDRGFCPVRFGFMVIAMGDREVGRAGGRRP